MFSLAFIRHTLCIDNKATVVNISSPSLQAKEVLKGKAVLSVDVARTFLNGH